MRPRAVLQVRQGGVGAPDGAPQVDPHQVFVPVQVLGLHVREQGLRRDAGVVDQGIDAAERAAAWRPGRGTAPRRDTSIGTHQHLRAEGLALRGDGVELVAAARGQHQGRARAVRRRPAGAPSRRRCRRSAPVMTSVFMVRTGWPPASVEAGPELVGQRHHDLGPGVEREHAPAARQRAAPQASSFRVRHGQRPAAPGAGAAIGASRTGRLTSAANTPSAMAMYQTMS